jgi:hypothetical protein
LSQDERTGKRFLQFNQFAVAGLASTPLTGNYSNFNMPIRWSSSVANAPPFIGPYLGQVHP